MATLGTGGEEMSIKVVGVSTEEMGSPAGKNKQEEGRERLKRHRNEVAGRIRVPELWGQEDFLKEWSDCSNQFDASLSSTKIFSARAALLQEAAATATATATRRRSANINIIKASPGFRIDSRC